MSSVIETIERAQLRRVPDFAPGDRVKVHFQVIEGTRRRVQVFEGVVIKRQGHGARETFTVRKQSFGVGVERMFPVHSPKIERIELAARGDVRRAKLYYLRDRVGKRARVRERRYTGPEQAVEPGLLHETGGATDADGMTAEEAVAEGAQGRTQSRSRTSPRTTPRRRLRRPPTVARRRSRTTREQNQAAMERPRRRRPSPRTAEASGHVQGARGPRRRQRRRRRRGIASASPAEAPATSRQDVSADSPSPDAGDTQGGEVAGDTPA